MADFYCKIDVEEILRKQNAQKEEAEEELRRRENQEKTAIIEAKRAEYMDPMKNEEYMQELFQK